MKIVLFTHYSLFPTASMPRFERMIVDGMLARGHTVEHWSCPVVLGDKNRVPFFSKWLGYLDQFILFPLQIKKRLACEPADTLFVITDQALGPWVPWVAKRPHAIHCHDFLAQRSALGEIAENVTGATGRLYQRFIRRGYRTGQVFIPVSKNTENDLSRFMSGIPHESHVVYNGLNYPFDLLPSELAMDRLLVLPAFREIFGVNTNSGLAPTQIALVSEKAETPRNACILIEDFLLHVGGGQWYKNREGVILIYQHYCEANFAPLPLVIIGRPPSGEIRELARNCRNGGRILFVSDATDAQVHAAYSLAKVFLFPSLAEGFGWPIAEAMASGCPVITTGEAPMTEVAGDAAFLIKRRPFEAVAAINWARESAAVLEKVIRLDDTARATVVAAGVRNAARFTAKDSLDMIEKLYLKILSSHQN